MKISVKRCRGITCQLIAVSVVFEVIAVVDVFVNGTQMLSVNEPSQIVSGPFQRVGVPITCVVYISTCTRDLIQGPLEAVVCCEENALVFRTGIDYFHDVNFTACSPNAVGRVRWQHPDSRPHAIARGGFRTYFDASVLEVEFVNRAHTRRCVIAVANAFLPRLDYERRLPVNLLN